MTRAIPGVSGTTGTGFFFSRLDRFPLDAVVEPPLELERVDVLGAAPTPAEALVTAES
jgi:hypothetical protein